MPKSKSNKRNQRRVRQKVEAQAKARDEYSGTLDFNARKAEIETQRKQTAVPRFLSHMKNGKQWGWQVCASMNEEFWGLRCCQTVHSLKGEESVSTMVISVPFNWVRDCTTFMGSYELQAPTIFEEVIKREREMKPPKYYNIRFRTEHNPKLLLDLETRLTDWLNMLKRERLKPTVTELNEILAVRGNDAVLG